jgi:hypothetical protein
MLASFFCFSLVAYINVEKKVRRSILLAFALALALCLSSASWGLRSATDATDADSRLKNVPSNLFSINVLVLFLYSSFVLGHN